MIGRPKVEQCDDNDYRKLAKESKMAKTVERLSDIFRVSFISIYGQAYFLSISTIR
jgi:hypothetical protein